MIGVDSEVFRQDALRIGGQAVQGQGDWGGRTGDVVVMVVPNENRDREYILLSKLFESESGLERAWVLAV